MNPLAYAAEAQRLAMRRLRDRIAHPAPVQDPPDTPAPLPQRPEPVRGFAWPQGEPVRRAVAPESESEKRAAWGDR